MGLGDDLKDEVLDIFKSIWTDRDGTVVPESDDIGLGNEAVKLDGVVLYADLSDSTNLVNIETKEFAAEIYKAYLYCAAKIIRSEGGEITAYDGDRVMAIYIGDSKNTSAAKTALKINYCVKNIINPLIAERYPTKTYRLNQTVGVDRSTLFIARTGIRGSNDLVWVGRAANYAAKLTSLSHDYPSRITEVVFNGMRDEAKYSDGKPMWEKVTWTPMGISIYRSSWTWSI